MILEGLVLFCEITKLRNHEIAKTVTIILVSRHLINWFGCFGMENICESCDC